MGHVDEALRRTGDAAGRTAGPTGAADQSSPWGFDDDPQASPGPNDARRPLDGPGAGQGMLGCDGQATAFRGFDAAVAERLVASAGCPPILAEQFRHLAATLHHAKLARKLRTVVVTSASIGDGKSFTATNLALTLSASFRRRVLLMDADLRRPSLHQVFRVPNLGLNEGLRANADERLTLIQITETLALLPGGRPELDPMSGLASARLRRVIEEAAARFDWVIIDTPPAGMLADAAIVSEMADTAILVIRAGITPFADVERAVAALGRDRILGVVLNAADPVDVHGGYLYDHYYGDRTGDERPDR